MKSSLMYTLGISKRKNGKDGIETIFEELMVEIS